MPAAPRPAWSSLWPNCGCFRDPGAVRTSTRRTIPASRRMARNSSIDRAPWPIVKMVGPAGAPSVTLAALLRRGLAERPGRARQREKTNQRDDPDGLAELRPRVSEVHELPCRVDH